MFKKKELKLIKNKNQESELIENILKQKTRDNEPLQILEAGCGRKWPYNFKGLNYRLTGLDLDKAALEIRKNTQGDLDEIIEGDLSSVDLEENKYDAIYSSFVLEHIKDADVVIKNFIKWLKPDGIIILKLPDPYSAHGYITRISPFWFHIFYHRFIVGRKNAGKPGYGPYPTYYHPVISRKGMREFCNDKNNNVEIISEYGYEYSIHGKVFLKRLVNLFSKALNILSFGKLISRHVNILFILRKQEKQNEQ